MKMKNHLLVLLMIAFPLVSAEEDVYCEVEKSKDEFHSFSSVVCRNISFQGNQAIRPKVHPSNGIEQIQLISVTVEINNNLLQYFPTADNLTIFDSNIKSFTLQSDIDTLKVFNSIFPNVSSDLLKGCKKLKRVTFMSNQGLVFDEGAFKDLRNLTLLSIINQTLPKIHRHIFKGLNNLLGLNLVWDNIQEIDRNAFLYLAKLYELHLDSNPIEAFNVDMSRCRRLTRLTLFNTNLKRLNFEVLGSMRKLVLIGLPGQLLKNTNGTELATKLPNIRVVYILSEELQCPKVISFVDELKQKEVFVMPLDIESISPYKYVIKPLVC